MQELYDHVRGLRGQVWLCSFPNLFITIAPAEWTFPRPYFLEPYAGCVFAGSYLMALHMVYLVRCVWAFLSNRFGHRFFTAHEWVVKTEYQGRGTPHWCASNCKDVPVIANSPKCFWDFCFFGFFLFHIADDMYTSQNDLNIFQFLEEHSS